MPVRVVSSQPVKTKKVICTKCGYELEFTGEDIRISGRDEDTQVIDCPRKTCQEILAVRWP